MTTKDQNPDELDTEELDPYIPTPELPLDVPYLMMPVEDVFTIKGRSKLVDSKKKNDIKSVEELEPTITEETPKPIN